MRILFLSENYFPNVSGVPVVVKYLAEGLLSKGHDVAVATQMIPEMPNQEVINGVTVYRFGIFKDLWHCHRGDYKGYVELVIGYKEDVTVFECT